ncbi:unnamed protein product [Adineta ricciae]|uniref:G-protein coupled receptors family 1 profile domain-containing protein n=1 Tax=Adineta ricciae TaxID=249248 RepID=A0A816BSH5_ADIRI|nr:unnamed protein product [Adineta ricciae]
MLVAGDELSRTQQGNNNAYCQDNEISWLNWKKADHHLLEFTRRLISLRRHHPVFRRCTWFDGQPVRPGSVEDIAWFKFDGEHMKAEDWQQDYAKSFGVFMNGRGICSRTTFGRQRVDNSFYIIFNAYYGYINYKLPGEEYAKNWMLILDTIRQRINNHVVLVLLILTFIQVTGELPLTLNFLHTGSAVVSSREFCQFWIIFNYMLFTCSLWTMAVASIQRYWLVFHRTFFDRHLFLLHYIPLCLCILYPVVLYSYLVTRYSCVNNYDYSLWTCGGACYLYEPVLGTLDWVVNGCINVLLSTFATLLIVIRVLIQKSRVTTQRSIWNRSRRLIVQLVALSTLYILVWLPCVICFVITLFTSSRLLSSIYSDYLSYYQYLSSLLCPFVCLAGLHKVRHALRCKNQLQPQNG